MIDKTTVYITTQRGIPLGYQGENEAREIVFPQPEELLVENWMLLHQRALDKEPYPVPLDVTARGLVWTVTAGDTEISGNGRAQLICTGADGEVLKTCTYNTVVSKSLHVGGEPPDPVKPWYDAIMEALEEGGGTVKTVNGVAPDENGNVTIETGSDVDELDALSALMDTGVVDPMADENGAVYVDEAGNLYSY